MNELRVEANTEMKEVNNDSLLAETPCFVLYYALTSVKKKKARWTGPLISSPAFCAAF
ncbi:hypothetical protein EfmAA610_27630 [Enterococcus faecium]|nr:hypothetical protein EfmAA610_27630 [Enterococcus faecium]